MAERSYAGSSIALSLNLRDTVLRDRLMMGARIDGVSTHVMEKVWTHACRHVHRIYYMGLKQGNKDRCVG